jgi:glycosyltransferase involved in cell wall biosynthesis
VGREGDTDTESKQSNNYQPILLKVFSFGKGLHPEIKALLVTGFSLLGDLMLGSVWGYVSRVPKVEKVNSGSRRRMKVGYLMPPTGNYGEVVEGKFEARESVGRWVWEVSRRLARSCEILVVGSRGGNREVTERCEGVQFIQVPLTVDHWLLKVARRAWRLRDPRKRGMYSKLYCSFYAMRAARAFRAQACDVVHIQDFSQFVPLMRRTNPQARIVLHMQIDWLVQLDPYALEARLADADAIVGISESVTEAIRKRFPNYALRCDTVFSGVDIDAFYPPANDAFCSKRDLIVWVGRLSPEKGVHVLLDAFEKVLAVRPGTRLELIGGPWVRSVDEINIHHDPRVRKLNRFYGKESYIDLLQRRLRMGLDTKVSRVGVLRHEELSDRMRAAALMVMPSLSEPFGMPVAEAMATGLPVVASRVGGLPELVVDGKTGLLVDPDDPAALAEAILRLLNDRALAQAMGKAGRLRAEQLFTWDQTVARLQSLYSEL